MNIQEIRMKNEEKIKELENYLKKVSSLELQKELDTQLKIQKVLEDEAIFFKINANDALHILKYYYEKEDLKQIYLSLISQEQYMELKKKAML